jgi:copper ion binding protein
MKILRILVLIGIVALMCNHGFSAEKPKHKMCLLKVEGMTCDKCATTVKKTLEGIKGVEKAKVSLEKKEAIVKFQEGVDMKTLLEAVNAQGYKASLKGDLIVLDIQGMHCNHCATEVKEVLEKQPDVLSADVSFENKEAVVSCQPGKVTLEQLVQVIEENTDYKAIGKNEKAK